MDGGWCGVNSTAEFVLDRRGSEAELLDLPVHVRPNHPSRRRMEEARPTGSRPRTSDGLQASGSSRYNCRFTNV